MSGSPWQLEKNIPDPILGPQAPNLTLTPVKPAAGYYFCPPVSPTAQTVPIVKAEMLFYSSDISQFPKRLWC